MNTTPISMRLFKILEGIFLFVNDIYEKRYTIYELTKRDFKTMYTGSVLGLTWSFIYHIMRGNFDL